MRRIQRGSQSDISPTYWSSLTAADAASEISKTESPKNRIEEKEEENAGECPGFLDVPIHPVPSRPDWTQLSTFPPKRAETISQFGNLCRNFAHHRCADCQKIPNLFISLFYIFCFLCILDGLYVSSACTSYSGLPDNRDCLTSTQSYLMRRQSPIFEASAPIQGLVYSRK